MLASRLRCEAGRLALRVGVSFDDALPPVPGMAWTRLWLAQGGYRGDLLARLGEALPFVDGAFDLVWLQHALEPAPRGARLLAEACRVLAPGGVLVVTALHPLGGWAPWFLWRARGQRQALQWPWRLRQRLRHEGLRVEELRRLGACWPRGTPVGDNPRGGGYLLLARKERSLALPLKWRLRPVGVSAMPLSPGARRRAVSERDGCA